MGKRQTKAAAIEAALSETVIQMIEVQRLTLAPENVRHTETEEDIENLADDIRGHGLLQSLIGYVGDDSVTTTKGPLVYVVGGGRRLRALQQLQTDNMISGDYLVPVSLRPQETAIEISLAENLARKGMNPVDEFRAFRQLMELHPGEIGEEQLAKRFGFPVKHVRQRMRLAGLHEDVLQALSDRKITIDAAMAYAATQDLDLQQRVFAEHSKPGAWQPHNPSRVRSDIGGKQLTSSSNLVRFIGLTDYEEAGGAFEDNLFTEESEERTLIDAALVRSLARKKAESALPKLATKEGYADLLLAPDLDVAGYNWKKPKAPKGYVEIVGWGDDLKKRVAAARALNAPLVGIAGIDVQGMLKITETVYMDEAFVEQVQPKQTRHEYVAPTAEEQAAAARQRGVADLAMKLAAPKFKDTPLEGRMFWPRWFRSDATEHPTLGGGYFLHMQVFITQAEFEAQQQAAEAAYDAELAAEAEREAAEERAEQERQDAFDKLIPELIANPPAVVWIEDVEDEEGQPIYWFKRDDGTYEDAREPGGVDQGMSGIEELLSAYADADLDMKTWATLEAFDAEHPTTQAEEASAERETEAVD